MPDYSKGKIYRIVCDTSGEVYYGSTIQSLSMRLTGHKVDAKRSRCSSKQIIDRGNYSIVLVEEYPCENKEQLARRERFYIDNNVCVNKVIPTRTLQEYRDVNKAWKAEYNKQHREHNKEYNKKLRDANRESLNEKARLYREDNKEKINERARDRRVNNIEEVRKKAREYLVVNRERINQKRRERRAKKKADALEQQL